VQAAKAYLLSEVWPRPVKAIAANAGEEEPEIRVFRI
jgi:hypothetical protein